MIYSISFYMMPDTFRVIFKMIIKIKLLKIIDVKTRQIFLFVVSTHRVESPELVYSLIYLAVHSQSIPLCTCYLYVQHEEHFKASRMLRASICQAS